MKLRSILIFVFYLEERKTCMAAVKTGSDQGRFVNERQLFYGTSPEIVAAICNQNFDWRLHGTNATVYGEGSYFALNSSYTAIVTLRKIPKGLSSCSWPRSSLGLTLLASPVIESYRQRSLRTQQVICTFRVLMICHVLPFSSFLILISSTRNT